MSQEPPTVSEPVRDDLAAARYWLDHAAAPLLANDTFNASNLEHLKIAATLGYGYSQLAHFERWAEWRAADLKRADERDRQSALAEVERTIREAEALNELREMRARMQAAQTTTRPEYELRDAHGDVLDDWYGDISEIVAAQARKPGSRIFRREVVTTEARSEWTEVTA